MKRMMFATLLAGIPWGSILMYFGDVPGFVGLFIQLTGAVMIAAYYRKITLREPPNKHPYGRTALSPTLKQSFKYTNSGKMNSCSTDPISDDLSEEFLRGRDAGLDGLSEKENPYDEGTYSHDDWEDGRKSVLYKSQPNTARH